MDQHITPSAAPHASFRGVNGGFGHARSVAPSAHGPNVYHGQYFAPVSNRGNVHGTWDGVPSGAHPGHDMPAPATAPVGMSRMAHAPAPWQQQLLQTHAMPYVVDPSQLGMRPPPQARPIAPAMVPTNRSADPESPSFYPVMYPGMIEVPKSWSLPVLYQFVCKEVARLGKSTPRTFLNIMLRRCQTRDELSIALTAAQLYKEAGATFTAEQSGLLVSAAKRTNAITEAIDAVLDRQRYAFFPMRSTYHDLLALARDPRVDRQQVVSLYRSLCTEYQPTWKDFYMGGVACLGHQPPLADEALSILNDARDFSKRTGRSLKSCNYNVIAHACLMANRVQDGLMVMQFLKEDNVNATRLSLEICDKLLQLEQNPSATHEGLLDLESLNAGLSYLGELSTSPSLGNGSSASFLVSSSGSQSVTNTELPPAASTVPALAAFPLSRSLSGGEANDMLRVNSSGSMSGHSDSGVEAENSGELDDESNAGFDVNSEDIARFILDE